MVYTITKREVEVGEKESRPIRTLPVDAPYPE